VKAPVEGWEPVRRCTLWFRMAAAHRGLKRGIVITLSLALVNIAGSSLSGAQSTPVVKDIVDATLSSAPPLSLMQDVAKNELLALHHTNSYLRYRMRIVNEKGEQVRDVVESRDGTVARLILKDGRPLTAEQDQGEQQRLNDMVASPSAYARHIKNGDSEKKIADNLVPLMPVAMLYSYVPGQPQTGRSNGAQEIVLDYRPNPKFVPPNTEAEALTGLTGRIWIDAKTHYLVRMEGTISRPVNFGWGMLAHIYPGGSLVLDQTNAGGDRWIFTHFSMRLSVRALMVKTMNVHSQIEASEFQTLPPMSYQDAIHLLLSTPAPSK
jgi:hypothetical protein